METMNDQFSAIIITRPAWAKPAAKPRHGWAQNNGRLVFQMSSEMPDFEQIHAEYRLKIHQYLARMVGVFEAEDLTQEVFVRVSQALPNFRGDSQVSTWVYRIATNAAIDRLRSPGYRRTVELAPYESADSSSPLILIDQNLWTGEKVPQIEPQVYRKEMSQCVQDYILSLPENYRIVLVLSEFEGIRNQEIAGILNISVDTVKIRLHRAKEKLKDILQKNCDSYWLEGNEFLPELK
jgi:RNA polymerase sigma-70 factor (ECF subfamily)